MDVLSYQIQLRDVFVFLCSCAISAILWRVYRLYKYWERRGVPYAKPMPFIGNLSFIMRKSVWQFFLELYQKHPDGYIGIFLGMQPALVVQSPELVRNVLVKDAECFQDRYLYCSQSDPLGSLNLFTVKNPIWTTMRQELTPMFTSARLRMLTELMNINSRELVKKIQRDLDHKKSIKLRELFSMYTSDTVGYTVFGLRLSILSEQPSPIWTITRHMVRWTFSRGLEFSTIFLLPGLAKLLRLNFFSAEATEYVKQLFWNVVDERRKTGTTNDKDLVHLLLKLKEDFKLPTGADASLAENLMLAQAAVFILGSIETSSTTLTYCLHELAYHPYEQEKLYAEIKEAFIRSGKDSLNYDELMDLKYLSSCIYETLRKYPPVAYLERVCDRDYQLGAVTVRQGTPVLVNVVGIHWNPDIYPEPHEWRPDERPCVVNNNDNRSFTFLPFGDGPRYCIGKRLGMVQVRAALAQVIHQYRVKPGPGPYEVKSDPYSVLLAPKNGGCVQFVARDSSAEQGL